MVRLYLEETERISLHVLFSPFPFIFLWQARTSIAGLYGAGGKCRPLCMLDKHCTNGSTFSVLDGHLILSKQTVNWRCFTGMPPQTTAWKAFSLGALLFLLSWGPYAKWWTQPTDGRGEKRCSFLSWWQAFCAKSMIWLGGIWGFRRSSWHQPRAWWLGSQGSLYQIQVIPVRRLHNHTLESITCPDVAAYVFISNCSSPFRWTLLPSKGEVSGSCQLF